MPHKDLKTTLVTRTSGGILETYKRNNALSDIGTYHTQKYFRNASEAKTWNRSELHKWSGIPIVIQILPLFNAQRGQR